MRVHEDDGGGGQLQRAPRKRAWIDRRMIHRAAPDNRVGDQLVLGAEIGDARLLVLLGDVHREKEHLVADLDRARDFGLLGGVYRGFSPPPPGPPPSPRTPKQ